MDSFDLALPIKSFAFALYLARFSFDALSALDGLSFEPLAPRLLVASCLHSLMRRCPLQRSQRQRNRNWHRLILLTLRKTCN